MNPTYDIDHPKQLNCVPYSFCYPQQSLIQFQETTLKIQQGTGLIPTKMVIFAIIKYPSRLWLIAMV